MRINPMPVYQKGVKRKKDKKRTAPEILHHAKVALLRCVVCKKRPVQLHHALTGAGGRRDHMKVLPLCVLHHTGKEGIHTLGRKKWAILFGTEQENLEKVERMLK